MGIGYVKFHCNKLYPSLLTEDIQFNLQKPGVYTKYSRDLTL
jgi:hypothetical protein